MQPGEEQQLLDHCGLHLRAVVVAAIDSGLRHGEILGLQWEDVRGMTLAEDGTITWAPAAALFLPALKTKTKTDRRIPISTRLRAVLEMRRLNAAGEPMEASAYVFGTEVGTRVAGFKRAWYTALLKSHGYTPAYAGTNLAPESQAALKTIGLHFHDLRREAGSRWMDGGVPLATIQKWLGHTNISMTSTYLAGTSASEDEHMRQFEVRQAVLQRLATKAKTGGRKRLQTATRQDGKTNKAAVGRGASIM